MTALPTAEDVARITAAAKDDETWRPVPPALEPAEGQLQVLRIHELRPDDIIVFSSPRRLASPEFETITRLLKITFATQKVVVIDGGAKIEVVRP